MTTDEIIKIGQEGKPLERAEAIAQINSELSSGTCELTEEQIQEVYGSPITRLKIEKYVRTTEAWANQRMFIAWLQVATGATIDTLIDAMMLADVAIDMMNTANNTEDEQVKASVLKTFEDKLFKLEIDEGKLHFNIVEAARATNNRRMTLKALLNICAGVDHAAREAMVIKKGGKKLVPPDILEMLERIQQYLKNARNGKTFNEMTEFERIFFVPSNMIGEDLEAYESFIKDFRE